MTNRIGIRLEDKNEWERRVPLVPDDVRKLGEQGITLEVERFPRRTFSDDAFAGAGATMVDDVRGCDLVLGVKEMPIQRFRPGGAYVFFSHTIKGQPYNLEMLSSLVEQRCTLIDYEVVTDEAGRRVIFFGRYAGLAGMIDTLWTLGRRLAVQGHETPFLDLEPTHAYPSLEDARRAVVAVGERIAAEGLPEQLAPLTIGLAGYGNVSLGAQEIVDLLPVVEVAPEELASFVKDNKKLTDKVVKVVYREEHLVETVDDKKAFELQEYYDHPERYRSSFEPHLSGLSVLVNCIYWEERYPKLADAEQLAALYAGPEAPRLAVIGDITCDVDGSLACTVRDTEPGDPVYVYDPSTREAPSGFEGPGLAVMAVGNLPTELPREASETFSAALTPFMAKLAEADFEGGFEEADLPGPIRRAVILWRGEFTPTYRYMQEFLQKPRRLRRSRK